MNFKPHAPLIVEDRVSIALGNRLRAVHFVADACCGNTRMTYCNIDGLNAIVIACPEHGVSMLKDGKVEKIEI